MLLLERERDRKDPLVSDMCIAWWRSLRAESFYYFPLFSFAMTMTTGIKRTGVRGDSEFLYLLRSYIRFS